MLSLNVSCVLALAWEHADAGEELGYIEIGVNIAGNDAANDEAQLIVNGRKWACLHVAVIISLNRSPPSTAITAMMFLCHCHPCWWQVEHQ